MNIFDTQQDNESRIEFLEGHQSFVTCLCEGIREFGSLAKTPKEVLMDAVTMQPVPLYVHLLNTGFFDSDPRLPIDEMDASLILVYTLYQRFNIHFGNRIDVCPDIKLITTYGGVLEYAISEQSVFLKNAPLFTKMFTAYKHSLQNVNYYTANFFESAIENDCRKVNYKKVTFKTYLVHSFGFYKIGKAKNPKQRLKDMSVGNPLVTLVAHTDKDIESRLHKQYSEFRKRGEWFKLADHHVAEIMKEFELYGITISNQTI